jgi:tRNA-splicing ligase RtcB
MDTGDWIRRDTCLWELPPSGPMRVSVRIHAGLELMEAMDEKVRQQAANVACLPGIVGASHVMPDGHWGYGFPIGGVAAFDAARGGVVSAGGVGFDVSCGVRCLRTGLADAALDPIRKELADALQREIPAGVGSQGTIHLDGPEMRGMLSGGARWAVQSGWGVPADLERIEEHGRMEGADPGAVSETARRRQRDEMGTLGSGNHYLEVQEVTRVVDAATAAAWGLRQGELVVMIHCGSRGLGHQIGTDFLGEMVASATAHGLTLPDRELACAPIDSALGQRYLGAMRAAINCALANRQILTHLTRSVFGRFFPGLAMPLLFDVSHNTCKLESHTLEGVERRLHVHRKGATRAFGPGHPSLPEDLKTTGQPVLIGGSMGTASWMLAGTTASEAVAFSSACHGAGRAMSRHQALRRWNGRQLVDELASRGILIRCRSSREVAEEAPGAYKDVDAVVADADRASLARRVLRLEPRITVKG